MIAGCGPNGDKTDSKTDSHQITTDTSKDIFGRFKNKEKSTYNWLSDTTQEVEIEVSDSLIDKSMKDMSKDDMKQILSTIEENNDREHAKYIASNYIGYGYWIQAVTSMVKIAKSLKDFEKAKYIALNYRNYGAWTDAISLMVDIADTLQDFEKAKYVALNYRQYWSCSDAITLMVKIWKKDKDWSMLKYVATNYQGYGSWWDAICWMYDLANAKWDRDQLYYITSTYIQYWSATDAFLSMYNLYKLKPSVTRKSILLPLAQREYTKWTTITRTHEEDWTPLLPCRKQALAAAKTLLWK